MQHATVVSWVEYCSAERRVPTKQVVHEIFKYGERRLG